MRRVGDTLVVNVGSVGLPFDGDQRAAYGQFTWQLGAWQAEIIRLEYDWRQTERDFFETGYLAEGGPLVKLILDALRSARPNLFTWHCQYESSIRANEITIEDAVNTYWLAKGIRRLEIGRLEIGRLGLIYSSFYFRSPIIRRSL